MRESVKILSQDPPSSDNNNNKDVTKLKAMILIYPETQSPSPLGGGNIKQTLLLIGFKGEVSILTYFLST